MVGSGVDGCKTVATGGKTVCDVSSENTTLSSIVETLEERKLRGVGHSSRVNSVDLLNDDVRVTLDSTTRVDLLRGSEVVLLSVGEVTGLEVLDGHGNRESGVCFNGVEVLGVREL